MRELVTISEAARRLGLSRPRLSGYLKASGVKKTLSDGRELVAFEDAQACVQTLAARGKIRTGKAAKKSPSGPSADASEMFSFFREEMGRLRQENQAMREHNQALVEKLTATLAEVSALSQKLLEAPKPESPRPVQGATAAGPAVMSDDKLEMIAGLVDFVRGYDETPAEAAKPRRGFFGRLRDAFA